MEQKKIFEGEMSTTMTEIGPENTVYEPKRCQRNEWRNNGNRGSGRREEVLTTVAVEIRDKIVLIIESDYKEISTNIYK